MRSKETMIKIHRKISPIVVYQKPLLKKTFEPTIEKLNLEKNLGSGNKVKQQCKLL